MYVSLVPFPCLAHLLILSQVIFVIDGKYTAEKAEVHQRRLLKEKKLRKNLRRAVKSQRLVWFNLWLQLYGTSFNLIVMVIRHPERVARLREVLSFSVPFELRDQLAETGSQLFNGKFIQAPNEEDVEIGRRGGWVFTNDSDLLAYPSVTGIIKATKVAHIAISRQAVLTSLGLTNEHLLLLCATSGNDYAPNLPGVGIRTVLRSIKLLGSGLKILEQLVGDSYLFTFDASKQQDISIEFSI